MLNIRKVLSTLIFISVLGLFLFSINSSATDENLEQTRLNMKQATQRICVQGAKLNENMKDLDSDEYCGCVSEEVFGKMTDDEIKSVFFGKNKEVMQKKQEAAIATCMLASNSINQVVTKAFYKGCINGATKYKNVQLNMPDYCGCVSDKMSSNLTQQDMQDLLKIGQDHSQAANTNVSSKMINFASQCINQMVNK